MGKGIHSKMDETQWFMYLGHSNWTIHSLLSRFCSKKVSPFYLSYWERSNFLLPQKKEEMKQQGQKMGKGIHSKIDETQGFMHLGHSNWTIYSLLS